MRSQDCQMPYTAQGLRELSRVLRLHRKIAWIDPVNNHMAIKKSAYYDLPLERNGIVINS